MSKKMLCHIIFCIVDFETINFETTYVYVSTVPELVRFLLDISVYFMIGPLVQNCAFESMREFQKGEMYVFGPRLVAYYQATR